MSNQNKWSEWSGWLWSDDHRRYYRQRQAWNGDFEYDWNPTAPRTDSVDGLTDAFDNVNIHGQAYGQFPQYGGHNDLYTYSSAPDAGAASSTTAATDESQQQHSMSPPAQTYVQPSTRDRKGKGVDTSQRSHKSRQREKENRPSTSRRHRSDRGKGGQGGVIEENQDPFFDKKRASGFDHQERNAPPHLDNPQSFGGADESLEEPAFGPLYEENAQPAPKSHDERQVPIDFDDGSGYVPEEYIAEEPYLDEGDAEYSRSSHHPRSRPRRQASENEEDAFTQPPTLYDTATQAEEPDENEDDEQSHGYLPGEPSMPGGGSSSLDENQELFDDEGNLTPRAATPGDDQPGASYAPSPYAQDPYAQDPYAQDPYAQDPYSQDPYAPASYAPNPYAPDPYVVDSAAYGQSQHLHQDPSQPRASRSESGSAITYDSATHDERFVIEHSQRFAAGEVFKVIWSEPMGGNSKATETMTDVQVEERMGQRFYVGLRRFIIVANDEGHCTCVPILTYEYRACTKKGVKPAKHGIVYASGRQPIPLKNEPPLGFRPVRCQLDYPSEGLVKESRVNYSKLVTIEHNIRVFFIGRVVAEDFDIVDNAVTQCWGQKNRKGTDYSKKQQSQRRPRR